MTSPGPWTFSPSRMITGDTMHRIHDSDGKRVADVYYNEENARLDAVVEALEAAVREECSSCHAMPTPGEKDCAVCETWMRSARAALRNISPLGLDGYT